MNKFLKSVSCLLLAMLMGFGTACGGANNDKGDDNTNTEQPGGNENEGGGNEGGGNEGGGNEGGGNEGGGNEGGGNEGGGNEGGGNEGGGNEGGGNEGGGETPDVPPAQYSIDEVVSQLSSTVYSNIDLTDDETYGLSDISNVGVVQADVKELYPLDLTGAQVIDVSSISASSDYAKLQSAFAQAKTLNGQGTKAVIALPQNGVLNVNVGESNDGNYAFALDGYNGLYVQGNGCKILLDYNGFTLKGFVNVSNSSDVRFNDFTVDYKDAFAISGSIQEINDAAYTVTVKVNAEFNGTIQRLQRTPAYIQSYLEFDWRTKAPKEGGNFIADPNRQGFIEGYAIGGDEANGYTLSIKFADGQMLSKKALGEFACIAFAGYGFNGFNYGYCNNVYMENVTLATCPGMGVVGSRTTNIYMNRLNIAIPEGSSRLMTTTADGTHFEECFGEVKITNSVIDYTHDDALNIKSGYYYNLDSIDARNKTVIISRKTQGISMPSVGDEIQFYNGATFEYLGKGIVAEASGNETQYTIITSNNLTTQGANNWGNGVIATNVTKSATLTFENNIVRNKRNRGLLVQVRNAHIANNAFFNVGHGSISVHSALDQYNEATIPTNIVIENNKFENNNYLLSLKGDIHIFAQNNSGSVAPIGTIKAVTVHNNYISNSGNAGISMQASSDSTVSDNLFHNPSRTNVGEMYDCALELNNAAQITVSGNYQYYTLDSETHAGIITGGMTETSYITLSDNENIAYQVIVAAAEKTEVQKLTSAITLDGNLSDWEGQGNVVNMIGATDADGKRYEPEAYNSYFDVKQCKIAWSDEGIYVMYEVKDNALDFQTVNNFWLGDCFEMFLCTDLSMQMADLDLLKSKGGDVMQLACTPADSWRSKFTIVDSRTSSAIVNGKASIQSSCVLTADGYAGELFLPFSVCTKVAEAKDNGEDVAIAFVFGDSIRQAANEDGSDRKRLQVSNVPHNVEYWKTKTGKTQLFKFVETTK